MVPATREVSALTEFRERRGGPRIERPFPITVRGVDVVGEPLDIDTVLDNVSRGGLYMRLPRRVEPGAQLRVGIRLSEAWEERPGARVATRCTVLRVESTLNGEYGVALAFARHRVF
jgi:hypothetical protein